VTVIYLIKRVTVILFSMQPALQIRTSKECGRFYLSTSLDYQTHSSEITICARRYFHCRAAVRSHTPNHQSHCLSYMFTIATIPPDLDAEVVRGTIASPEHELVRVVVGVEPFIDHAAAQA
jgi:hypothetical protein